MAVDEYYLHQNRKFAYCECQSVHEHMFHQCSAKLCSKNEQKLFVPEIQNHPEPGIIKRHYEYENVTVLQCGKENLKSTEEQFCGENELHHCSVINLCSKNEGEVFDPEFYQKLLEPKIMKQHDECQSVQILQNYSENLQPTEKQFQGENEEKLLTSDAYQKSFSKSESDNECLNVAKQVLDYCLENIQSSSNDYYVFVTQLDIKNEEPSIVPESQSKSFTCIICEKSFLLSRQLKRHMRTHKRERPHVCEICQKSFAELYKLRDHQLTHSDIKPFVCEICQKSFHKSRRFKEHLRIHAEGKSFPCNLCSKSFYHRGSLREHLKTHSGVRPFKCEICKQAYFQFRHLKEHSRVHSLENHFVCEICQKTFTRLFSLKEHQRMHSGEKPYKCDICMKCFAYLKSLKNHHRTHTGEKPFMCEVCNKTFAALKNLNRHMRVHRK